MNHIHSLLIFACLGLSACDEYKMPEAPEPVKKKIILKAEPVEQRMGFDFFSNETFRQRSVTVYYLVAEDGTVAEVGLSDYAKTKIGDEFGSFNWKVKQL